METRRDCEYKTEPRKPEVDSRKQDSDQKQDPKDSWFLFKNRGSLWVHKGLFNRGLVAIKPVKAKQAVSESYSISDASFTIKDREFIFSDPDAPEQPATGQPALRPYSSAVAHASSLLNKLNEYSHNENGRTNSVHLLSSMPDKPEPNSYIFIREPLPERNQAANTAAVSSAAPANSNAAAYLSSLLTTADNVHTDGRNDPVSVHLLSKLPEKPEPNSFIFIREPLPENHHAAGADSSNPGPGGKKEKDRQWMPYRVNAGGIPEPFAASTFPLLENALRNLPKNVSAENMKEKERQWKAFRVNEAGKAEAFALAKLPLLEKALRNLPRNIAPENLSKTERQNLRNILDNAGRVILFNRRHRDEVFLQQEGLYVYPWLSRHDDTFQFTGFDEFVTAGCMFGASLKGNDQEGYSTALIKHDIKFSGPTQKLEEIVFDFEQANPYEEMLFQEFDKYASYMKKLSSRQTGQKPKLRYHLPYLDYILFGVELFIRGRITLHALDELFITIFRKKDQHVKRIQDICEKHEIDVVIESPFINLFGPIEGSRLDSSTTRLSISDSLDALFESRNHQSEDSEADNESPQETEMLARTILGRLNLGCEEIDPSKIDQDNQRQNEAKLVRYCLDKLQSNSFNTSHAQAWHDLTEIIGAENINNLEDLFKLANAVMIAVTTSGKKDFRICPWLPLSEKQIQVSYDLCTNVSKLISKHESELKKLKDKLASLDSEIASIAKLLIDHSTGSSNVQCAKEGTDKLSLYLDQKKELLPAIAHHESRVNALKALKGKYPAVFNITVMDHFITYGHKNNGLAFYNDISPEAVSDLLGRDIMGRAHANLSLFARRSVSDPAAGKPVKLQDFLAQQDGQSPKSRPTKTI